VSIIEKAINKAFERDGFQASPKPSSAPAAVGVENGASGAAEAKASAVGVPEAKRVSRTYPVDWGALKGKGMLVPEMATTQLAEEYRVIKRPLLMNAFPEEANGIERANLILVTSSVPGEGKTFTAMNLALSIAMERDRTVLLIDADVAKPSIAGLLGIPVEAGLTDLLKDKNLSFSDIAVKTDIPNFTLLPAGKQDRHSTELLASDDMRKLANELSSRYADRIVIFDSPPLLAATQGAVLARLVGQIVLVIEADSTPQYVVQESIGKLEGCEVIGCVLNKTKKGFGFNYYGYFYGYGYGYGYYGQQQQKSPG
jgi:exopolysaccharide/PEP-CTERM locus tyrosine autokinase